jgi:hypothetical protein
VNTNGGLVLYTDEYYDKIGTPEVVLEAVLFQNHHFYQSPDVNKKLEASLEKYLEKHTIFELSDSLN